MVQTLTRIGLTEKKVEKGKQNSEVFIFVHLCFTSFINYTYILNDNFSILHLKLIH